METKVCKCCGKELPITEFSKNGFGYTSVCKSCNHNNRVVAAEKKKTQKQQTINALNARQLRLHDFEPRELMAELKRRGYEGKLTYVETHVIDLSTI